MVGEMLFKDHLASIHKDTIENQTGFLKLLLKCRKMFFFFPSF